ncbi:MAG: response regulator [Bdellovibrionaceae bacterium]|nr:response regulator [Bdellovibrionales bacterium]MCB9086347.1 response regulator [Pseudobdellovibrionaceae bacterium]
MSKNKKIDTKDFLDKVKKMAKDRMSEGKVVSLDSFRGLEKKDPHRILIIEDDETMRAALKRIFVADGFEVVTVADGTHLTQVLDDSPIDLVILDIGLPWINGFELAQLMKEDQDLRRIPLIFVSGRTSDLDVRKGFELGAVDYIKKPFDVEKIRKTVQTLLKLNK